MDYNVKLELAKEYLRSRKKLVSEQVASDPNRFTPSAAIETDVKRTMNEYQLSTRKNKETGSSTVRFLNKKFSYKNR
jgi:hypothetical protein